MPVLRRAGIPGRLKDGQECPSYIVASQSLALGLGAVPDRSYIFPGRRDLAGSWVAAKKATMAVASRHAERDRT